MPKILLIDDHPVILAGCTALFTQAGGFDIRQARTVRDGLACFERFAPDVSIVDLNLEDGSGFDLIRYILNVRADACIVVFTMSASPITAKQCIEAGARGFVTKLEEPSQLARAVREVLAGGRWISESLLQDVAALGAPGGSTELMLSEKEASVLRLLVRGRSLAEIAETLDISYKTATMCCSGMRAKLNARTNGELVRIAIENRIV